jgi:aminopeptidase N
MRAISNKQELQAFKHVSDRKDSLVLSCDKRPTLVEIDPDFRLAAEIDLSGPQDLLRGMLKRGRSARVRKMAARALGKRHDPDNVEALGQKLLDEKESYIVRTQAASSLAKIGGPRALELVLEATSLDHPKVRRAVAQALGRWGEEESLKALVKLTGDKSYLVTASAARALGGTKKEAAEKPLVRLLSKDSWADVVRAGALDGLAKSGLESAPDHLITWSKYGKPQRARRAAISSLPHASEDRKVREHLIGLLRDEDPHTRSAVLSALGTLADRRASAAISELLERELDGRVRRTAKQVLSQLGKSGHAGLVEARQKTQKLERELSSLKARLARLEQLTGHEARSPKASGK